MRLSVQRLEKLGDLPSRVDLRTRVAAMLPVVDLPEVLIGVHSWTGMLDAYTHVGGLATSMEQLPGTLAALLVADAGNVGLVPVTAPATRRCRATGSRPCTRLTKAKEVGDKTHDHVHDAKNEVEDRSHDAKNDLKDTAHDVKNEAKDQAPDA